MNAEAPYTDTKLPYHPRRVAVLDIEATGMNQASHNSAKGQWGVSIGIRLFEDGKELESFSSIIKPVNHEGEVIQITDSAEHIHGISQEKAMQEGVLFSAIEDKVFSLLGFGAEDPPLLVCHHAPFDAAFLREMAAKEEHKTIPWERIADTRVMALEYLPHDVMVDLSPLCDHLGIPHGNRTEEQGHDALLDAGLTAQVFFKLEAMFPEMPVLAKEIVEGNLARTAGVAKAEMDGLSTYLHMERGGKMDTKGLLDFLLGQGYVLRDREPMRLRTRELCHRHDVVKDTVDGVIRAHAAEQDRDSGMAGGMGR